MNYKIISQYNVDRLVEEVNKAKADGYRLRGDLKVTTEISGTPHGNSQKITSRTLFVQVLVLTLKQRRKLNQIEKELS